MVGTRTPNYNLYKPLSGETGYDGNVNANFDTIDAALIAMIPKPSSPIIGDILVWSGTAWVRMPAAAVGEILTSQGVGALPTWSAPAITQANLNSLPTFVSGMITIWSGSIASIPAGFILCNGSNNTPDLRDKFVVGAGDLYAVGATGGEATHLLSAAESGVPAHGHTVTFASNDYDGNGVGDYYASGTANVYNSALSTANVNLNTAAAAAAAHNNLPPYYALAYIMKT